MGPAFVSEYQASRGQNRYQRADGAKGALKEKERKNGKIKVINAVRTRRNSPNKVGNSTTVQNIMYAHTVEILEADESIPVKGQFHILNFFEGFKMVLE